MAVGRSNFLAAVCPTLLTLLLAVDGQRQTTSLLPADQPQFSGDGCMGAGLCCAGRNMSCSAIGRRPDNKKATSTCYCDEACNTLGDCCLDYRAACRAINCVVSATWSDWSECDARCGYGVQIRTKQVLVKPVNGGRPCSETIERRLCEGTNCKLPRTADGVDQLKETATIVPASFGGWRSDALYSPFADIRQNLFTHFKYAELKDRLLSKPSYCAKFVITETRAACQRSGKILSAKAAGGLAPTTPLPLSDDPSNNMTSSKNMLWPTKLVRGSTVCVECQQFAMQSTVGRRCAGHGVFQRETAWKAAAIPRCHGKWLMTTRHEEPCQCDPTSDTSFVFV